MVVIEQYSSTQFNSLSNTRARILYDTTQNAIRWNDSTSFNNFLLSKDSNNNVTGINNVTMTGTLNISNAGTNGIGLELGGTLVTVTGEQLNYNNVTPGIVSATKTMVVDANRNITNLNKLNTTGNMGINTTASVFGLEVSQTTGQCLRLSYNDATGVANNKCDFTLSPTGSLTIQPTGSNPSMTVTANINTVAVSATKTNASDVTVDFPLSLTVLPDDTPSIGLGSGIEFNTTNNAYAIFNLGTLEYYASDLTDGAEYSQCRIRLSNNDALSTVLNITSGGVTSCTSFIETSDIRMKENINDIEITESSSKINKLNVKSYNYIHDDEKRKHYGLIAQEVLDIIPEVVFISKTEELDDFHQIHYSGLVPHLINCTKDIYKKLDIINTKLHDLYSKLNINNSKL
jgi:hypothetical protein